MKTNPSPQVSFYSLNKRAMALHTCVNKGNESVTDFWQPQRPLHSEVKSHLRFEISYPNYLLIHVHIAYMLWALLAASKATKANKQTQRSNLTSDLKSVTPNYLLIYVHIADMVWTLLASSEATTASKQPQISNLTSDLKSVTPVTYLSMCILINWFGPSWQPPRPPQPQNSLGGQIWPQIWNQWPQLPTYPCAYCLYDMGPLGSLGGHYSLQTASEVFVARWWRQTWPIALYSFAASPQTRGQWPNELPCYKCCIIWFILYLSKWYAYCFYRNEKRIHSWFPGIDLDLQCIAGKFCLCLEGSHNQILHLSEKFIKDVLDP